MVVGRRGPYLTKAAFRHQALVPHGIPEWTANCAGIGSSIENGAHDFYFAGPGIAMFAYVTIKAQDLVVPSLPHTLLLQKVNRKNRRVSAVSAADRERPILQIRERRNGTS